MKWFQRWRRFREPAREYRDNDSWITVPFRFAEAARVSIHTIGSQPEIPVAIRWWIAQWLASYNSQLVCYMRENYGPDIFPLLDQITEEVMPKEEDTPASMVGQAEWEKWERQFREDDGGGS